MADQLVGTTSAAQNATLRNTGMAPVNFSGIQAATNFAHTTDCGNSLPAGANCGINVAFAPQASGPMTEQITITHDSQGSPRTIVLNGKGTDFSVVPATGAATDSAGEKAA